MKATKTTPAPRPCSMCRTQPSKPGEKFCGPCKKAYLKEMREKHPGPQIHKVFNDSRGRKDGRSAHKLSGDADMRQYLDEMDHQ